MKILLSLGLLFTTISRVIYAQATVGGCPVFPANNIWNTPIDHLPVASNSATLVNTIGASKGFHPDFSAGLYQGRTTGIPYSLVTGAQPLVPVTFAYPQEADPGPYRIPLNTPWEGAPATTGDRHVITVDTTNCKLYELYAGYPESTYWRASSGAMWDLRSHALRPDSWTSADAAGLPIMPGLITVDEIAAGEIKHAIRFTAPSTRRAYVWPARHYASSLTGSQYPRMGERFRLKANFNISSYPADVQVILKAMKKYGIILADNGGSWYFQAKTDNRWNNENLNTIKTVLGSNFEAVDASVLMIDPNSGEAKQTGVQLNVTPGTSSVYVGANQQFTAQVSGASSTAVTWSVDGVEGGSAARGYIGSTGLYQAPANLPSSPTVVVAAKSVAAPNVTDTANVTLSAYPNISSWSPSPITTSSFTLTLTGSGFRSGAVVKFNGTNLPTTWLSSTQVRATGTIAASDSSIPITVTNSDGAASNTVYATATISSQLPIQVKLTPTAVTLAANATQQFVATVLNSTNQAIRWKVNGVIGGSSTVGTVSTTGLYKAPSTVPSGGLTVTLSATSIADPLKITPAKITLTSSSASSPSTTLPIKVTLTPTTVTLKANATQQFVATVLNSTNQAIRWKVNGVIGGSSTVGTVSTTGLYKAPSTVPSGGLTVTLSATSIADPLKITPAKITLTR